MTRRLSAGWENREKHEQRETKSGTESFPAWSSFDEGVGYMRMLSALSEGNKTTWKRYEFESASEVWVSLNWYVETDSAGAASPINERFRLQLDNDADSDVLDVFLNVEDDLVGFTWGAQAESTTLSMEQDTWYLLIVHAKVDPGGGEVVQVWVDGINMIDWSGAVGPDFSEFDRVILRGSAEQEGPGFIQVGIRVDNLVVNDTLGSEDNGNPGQVYFVGLPVTGAGAQTNWDRGGVDSGNNWDQVDEVPADAAEWVETDTDAEVETYEATDVPASIDEDADYVIRAVHVVGMVKLGAVSANNGIYPILRSGGNNYQGTLVNPGVVWQRFSHRWTQDPDTGADWVKANINTAEPGQESQIV
jgi:hypothetical protein